jgi:TrmH family RNA methyltransferase
VSRAVTSLANPAVRAARALHMKKAREESGQFLAEGLKIVTEAVELGRTPRMLLFSAEAKGQRLLERAIAATEGAGGEVIEVSGQILGKISRRDNPQTVLGVFDQAFAPLESLALATAPAWVALEAVRDPGNLGTILRTADAAGCGGVVLVGDCCDPCSVEAVRASMGSIFAVKIARAAHREFLAWREAWPGSVVGTLLTAKTDFRAAAYERPTLILMGNERSGLSPELAQACDVTVKIPMRGRADSLNLAVATGIMIYAATLGPHPPSGS